MRIPVAAALPVALLAAGAPGAVAQDMPGMPGMPGPGGAPGAGGTPAAAAPARVDMPGKYFQPPRVSIIAGQSVTWANKDFTDHDVESDDGSFGSGRMSNGNTFSHTFAAPGTYPYRCTIHLFMRGQVDVFAFALRPPAAPVAIGERAVLSGLAPPGTLSVTIERLEADGSFVPVGSAPVRPDGAFRAGVVAARSAVYRALAGTVSSAPLSVPVSAHMHLSARRLRGPRVELRATASPAQPGAPVALELYSRERFDWRRVAHARLDRRSAVRFRFNVRRTIRARVVLQRGTAGYGPGISHPATLVARRSR